MMIDRRLFREIDWVLVGLVLFQCVLGLLMIYSSSHFISGNYFLRQLIWVGIGILAVFVILAADYKFLVDFAFYFYGAALAFLAGSLLFARLVAGTRSWITFGLLQFQPSEVAKVVLILVFARLFGEYKSRYLTFRFAALPLGLAAVPLALIILQPDLGTAMTFAAVIGGAFVLAGTRRRTLAVLLVFALILGFGGWHFGMKDYQKKRVTTLLDPSRDPHGSGYQVIQSRIAIGSGGLTGKGFMNGSQSQLRFLPARHTDFIFSVIGEEFGFVGVFLAVLLYMLMLARMFLAVNKARDRTGVYIVFMAGMLVAFQFFINIMMIVGLFPVTGIPLPFLSYGGSSLLTNFILVGLVLNVRMRRFANV
jgi:rod shape determining protein RodA